MKVKIDFYRKCFYCLHETQDIQSLTWENIVPEDDTDDFMPIDEDLEIMLNQLHIFKNIKCPNCNRNDHFGFSVEKVNNKPYQSDDESDDDYLEDDVENKYKIHNDILKYSKVGPIVFILKNGEQITGELDMISSSYKDDGKRYFIIDYRDIDLSKPIHFQKNFGIETSYKGIELSDIQEVDLLIEFDKMYWKR